MTNLQIKNVPLDVHEAVRQRAAEEGMTMSDYVLDLLRRELALPTQRQWLAQLKERPRVGTRNDVIAALDAVREARDEELASGRDRH